MKVSVIIPGYKTEYVQSTLESLHRQTLPAHEIIYVHCLKTTAAEKINQAVKFARGDAVIVLSDDDMLHPDFIAKTAKLMDSESLDIVYTDMVIVDGKGYAQYTQPASDYTFENFKVSTVPWMTSLIRKTAFDKVGGWDEEQLYQDYDFYFRCFKAGLTGKCIHEPLFIYRKHATMDSLTQGDPFNNDARRKMKAKHPEIL